MAYQSKHTGVNIDNNIDKINNLNIDSSLSATSTNPIQNKTVYEIINIRGVPEYSSTNNNSFLRIINGKMSWENIPLAEEETF